jgi:23S rRNA pseudouridine1911/1915/1917 synthase
LARRTLAAFVSQGLDLSESEARGLVERGAVYLNGRRCLDPGQHLATGQRVGVVLSESGQAPDAQASPHSEPVVLFQDALVLAVSKPAGMTTQATPSRMGASLWDWARSQAGGGVGLVHRLDRETSGVVVFGRGSQATKALTTQFRERTVKKVYLAITAPHLPERGEIDLPLSPDPSRPGRYRASAHANGRAAHTDYERRFQTEAWAGVALFPRTGRTHQLRAHFTAIGFPIAGDRLYGGASQLGSIPIARCLLHARSLSLRHPSTGEVMTLEALPPPDFARFWQGPP